MTRILLTGTSGQLGWELQSALQALGDVTALDRTNLDLLDIGDIRRVIHEVAPDIIVNAAGYTNVDKAESEPELAHRINAVAPEVMAEEARKRKALLVHYSTDYVFDGTKHEPYLETDTPNPLNAYGRTKLIGEQAIIATGCRHLILRASWIYSSRRSNFVLTMLRLCREKSELHVVDDQVGSPSWARMLAASSAEVLAQMLHRENDYGIYHLSASGYTTRLEFARKIIEIARRVKPEIKWAEVLPTTTAHYPLPAMRPLHAATCKAKIERCFGIALISWQKQIDLFMQSRIF